ncbi:MULTISPECIES: CheW domain-containing protein [Pseudomonas]|uniref:CheW domain protein n=1 Tax=Pseudomonas fulva (strain 12-X) TaxID=743720 RepID=F6A8D7_PSEF1|nr:MULTISPECIES: CheW domain-containing protein [Pseudomonas]AEF21924.1 CheW domain protein [Pseudomonas fulva 12-X]MBV7562396.1 chemotaxis protein CheW [Pseudomonas sp. sia0905]PZW71088.1 purine-binding chemotaxis protein CheW [Pseudomonas sp. URMO17WK12:I1]
MSRTTATATRPQLALQSYLDGLLQDAAIELEQTIEHSTLDDFEAAVLEEQVRDAQLAPRAEAPALTLVQPAVAEVVSEPVVEVAAPVAEVAAPAIVEPIPMPPVVEPVADVNRPAPQIFSSQPDGRPDWAEEPFECLLFDVAGLTLAVPLVCLGSIYPLAGQELTPLFGQPDWFLGILPSQSGNLKVLDTARWVMPDRYRDDFKQGLQYVISVQGYEWGLAVHQVSRSIRLNPDEVKWRSQRAQRPWLAGTVIEHMCALLDVAALAELIASGATKRMHNGQIH